MKNFARGCALLFLCLPLASAAKPLKFAIRSLSQGDLRKADEPALKFSPPSLRGAEVQACLVSACGPASQNPSAMEMYERVKTPSLFSENAWATLFEARMSKGLKEKRDEEIRKAEAQARLLRDGERLDLKSPFRALATYFHLMSKTLENAGSLYQLTDDRTAYVIDPFALIILKKSLNPGSEAAARRLAEDFLDFMNMNLLSTLGNPLKGRLQVKHPGLSPREAQIRDAAELLETLEKVERNHGSGFTNEIVQSLDQALIHKAGAGEDLSAVESAAYVEAAFSMDIVRSIYARPEDFRLFMSVDLPFESWLREMRDEDWAGRRLRDLKAVSLPDLEIDVWAYCKVSLREALELETSDLRVSRAARLFEDVKKASRQALRRFPLSPPQIKAAERALDGIQFSLPPSRREKLARLEHALKDGEADVALLKRTDWNGTGGRQQLLWMGLTSWLQKSEIPLKKEELEIYQACKALPASVISDAAQSSLGKISVSWYALNYPEFGVSIVAHEVGHILSRFLRKQAVETPGAKHPITDSLNCVVQRNPNTPWAPALTASENTTWSEEDWADHFSSLVMNEMKRMGLPSYSPKNMGCALIAEKAGAYDGNQNLSSAEDDSHSSNLLRLLFIAADRESLSPECRGLFEKGAGHLPLQCGSK